MRRFVWLGLGLVVAIAGTSACGGGSTRTGSFVCGDSAKCDGAKQYCYHHYVEGQSGDSFECRVYPEACAGDQTCACLRGELEVTECPVDECSDAADGLTLCEVGA